MPMFKARHRLTSRKIDFKPGLASHYITFRWPHR
jgi:hypothetical protein